MDYCRLFSASCKHPFYRVGDSREIIQPTGEKYSQSRPMLSGKTSDSVCGLCDIVGRITISPKDGERYLWMEGSQTVVAKDRLFKRKFCKFEEVLNNGVEI